MIKKIRVVLSVIIFLLLSLLLLDFFDWYTNTFSWLAKIQFIPSALSFCLGIFVFWLLVTLLFGRVYCSSVCPLGTLQDFFSRIRGTVQRNNKKRYGFHYRTPINTLRYATLGIFVLGIGCSISIIPALLDPYSAYGRIISTIYTPVKNLYLGNEMFQIIFPSLIGMIIGYATLIIVGFFSYKNGRILCNTICPVGSTLGLISSHSVWQFEIDTDACVGCLKCEINCKASCINLKDHTIDVGRCVMCFNCLNSCKYDAIKYVPSHKRLSKPLMQSIKKEKDVPQTASMNMDRRKFLSIATLVAGSYTVVKASDKVADLYSGLTDSKPIRRLYPITPPGIISAEKFHQSCTSCMLCINNCPKGVMQASIREYGLFNLLQPTLKFDDSFCDINCNICTQICPTGALKPLTVEEKGNYTIGTAKVVPKNCIHCGRCAENCPKLAITMSVSTDTPIVNDSQCIGCGTCESVCPANPVKAIYVDGNMA